MVTSSPMRALPASSATFHGFVQSQHSRNCFEVPLHMGDHHVFDLEFGPVWVGSRFQAVLAVCGTARVVIVAIVTSPT